MTKAQDPFSPEGLSPLSVGAVYGGYSPSSEAWRTAITCMTRAITKAQTERPSTFKLNVIFQVLGDLLDPGYLGVRTGHYSRKHSALIVQVGLPMDAPVDVDAFVVKAMKDAIDEAEPLARRRARVEDLSLHREILADAITLMSSGKV